MDKKIVIPAGLAVLVVMAVVGMLSIFTFGATPTAEASLENLNTVEKMNVGPAATCAASSCTDQVTTVAMTANPSLVGDTSRLTITFLTTGTLGYVATHATHTPTSGSTAGTGDLAAGSGEISIRFDSSKFKVPATIANTAVTLSTTTTSYSANADAADVVVNPSSVTVSTTGAENDLPVITLVVPDMDPSDGTGGNGIGSNATVTVTILQTAGVSLPVKAGGYDISVWTSNDASTDWAEYQGDEITLYRDVTLSAVSGSRGDTVTATASGYSSGTATFWNDDDSDGVRDAAEVDLCTGSVSSSTATCDFTVSNPPFILGKGTDAAGAASDFTNGIAITNFGTDSNLVNAVDGESNEAQWSSQEDADKALFELEGSISVVPSEAAPGDVVTVQVTDGTASSAVSSCNVSGVAATACTGTLSASGMGDITFTVGNALAGTQKLYVTFGATTLKTNITITSASLTVTPADSIVPNQRITVTGSGFTAGGTIPDTGITIGAEEIRDERFNDDATINIDNGGSFSTSIDIPQTAATETTGVKTLKITDSGGRVGEVEVTVAPRTMTITPAEGRVGSNVTVKGAGFPSKNNDGSSNTVTVTYTSGASTNTATVTPDAGGNFTTTVQVPSGASIPSTNTVQAAYNVMVASSGADNNTDNLTTATHKVPAATATLSAAAGGAGSTVTVTGTGFKRYTTVTSLQVGDIDVTPSPKPTSDTDGNLSFDFVVPGTDTGVQTVELNVGGTTASVGYTVTSDIVSDVITPTADALEPLLTAGTLASAFYFNNATKEFDFHIVDDAFTDANTLANVQGGEPLWIEVTSDTTAELGGTSFDLTCVNGDCFNLIVFP
jgi:hypothetical protein